MAFRVLVTLVLLAGCAFAADCPISGAFQTGTLQDPNQSETSGLVASRTQPGVLYTHNDHGDTARIFVMHENGDSIATLSLEGVTHVDFEDITIGSGPEAGVDYIYLGDIGSNDYDRDEFFIYRFKEPNLKLAKDGLLRIASADITKITLTTVNAPDEDMETLMSDPISGDLYILTKNHDVPEANIYRVTPPAEENALPILMTLVGSIQNEMLVAGDISPDGQLILLREAKNVAAWMWNRRQDEPVELALMGRSPCFLDLEAETQGEAIAVKANGSGFYTTSEGVNEPVYSYDFFL